MDNDQPQDDNLNQPLPNNQNIGAVNQAPATPITPDAQTLTTQSPPPQPFVAPASQSSYPNQTPNTNVEPSQTPMPVQATTQPPKKRHLAKWFAVSTIVLFIVVVLPSVALGYIGVMPVMTEIMQTNKPVDLGVTYTADDFNRFQSKSLISFYDYNSNTIDPSLPSENLAIAAADTVGNTFTQSEITAALNSINWLSIPIKNAQVRLSEGVIEISGNLNAQYVADAVKSINDASNGQANLSPVLNWAKYFQDPAIYVKANLWVEEDTTDDSGGILNFQLLEAKVNRFDLPADLAQQISNTGTVSFDTKTTKDGLDVRTLSIIDGAMDWYGTMPGVIYLGSGSYESICQNNHYGYVTSLDLHNGRIGSTVANCE